MSGVSLFGDIRRFVPAPGPRGVADFILVVGFVQRLAMEESGRLLSGDASCMVSASNISPNARRAWSDNWNVKSPLGIEKCDMGAGGGIAS